MTQQGGFDTHQFTAVDIFAGGGGLTVGLKRAGFNVVAAIELEKHAFSTYKANHPEVQGYMQDVRTISGKTLLKHSATNEIDLLAGCPPCQGFSSLTSKYRRIDSRNKLVSEMSRLVEEIQPRAVMMENVPGLVEKGKELFDEFLQKLETFGYVTTWNILQVANYGVPQNRRRLVLLAGKGFPIQLPEATHSRTGSNGLSQWKTLREAIGSTSLPNPVTVLDAKASGGPHKFNWHIIRNISPKNLQRLQSTQPGESRSKLPQELRPTCHQDKEKGYTNVYGRMAWEQIPVTMTGGCTNISKGRFGHPDDDRTISVREAALIQTFPMEYIFDTPYIDYACNIIGNALPCDFADIVAQKCYEALNKNEIDRKLIEPR